VTPVDGNNLPKKQRREAAREHARQLREQEAKRRRRNRWLAQGGVIVAVLAIVAVVAVVIVNAAQKEPPTPLSSNQAGPANMISDGILLTGPDMKAVRTPGIQPGQDPVPTDPSAHPGVANIVTYVDYQCPVCQLFEAVNGANIKKWVEDGDATIEIHPITFLDNMSQGNKYSSRAANAMACVANYQPDVYYDVNTAIYVDQPAEGSKGMSDDKLISVLQKAGATDENIPHCVKSLEFGSWVAAATSRAMGGAPLPNSDLQRVTGTPTIIVNGKEYTTDDGSIADAQAFQKFVQSMAGQ